VQRPDQRFQTTVPISPHPVPGPVFYLVRYIFALCIKVTDFFRRRQYYIVGMGIFFTSDHHFYHTNVIRYCNRPYQTVEEMNEALVRNWNDRVSDSDTVYVLGDFSFSARAAEVFAPRLSGEKIFICGNHDRCFPYRRKGKKSFSDYIGYGFSAVFETLEITVPLGGVDTLVRMSHFPYQPEVLPTHYQLRYVERRLENDGVLLLHGHVHNHWKKMHNQINVGVDVWDYRPVSIFEIEQILGESVIQDEAYRQFEYD
jgi:calcineurin-like phosphoesterase family protein